MFSLLVLFLVSVSSQTTVAPGTGTLSAAISSATTNTSLILTQGATYTETGPINITVPVQIIGNGAILSIPSASASNAFNMMAFWASVSNLTISDSTTSTSCSFSMPISNMANFSQTLLAPSVRNNAINVNANLGSWFDTRTIYDVLFASCSYQKDGDPNANSKMTSLSWSISTTTCQASLSYKIKFDKLQNCGVQKTKSATYNIYLAEVQTIMEEYVTHTSPTKLLRSPIWRKAQMSNKLRIQINTQGSVVAALTVNYPSADLQAVISAILMKAVDGVNTSTVILEVTLPAPYTIGTGSTGPITLSSMNQVNPNAVATNYVTSPQCDGLATGAICNQTLSFNITACDLTGNYEIKNLNVICMPSAVSAKGCPANTGGASFLFFISASDMCVEESFNLSALFQLTIVPREDSTYAVTRSSLNYNLGETSFWAIQVWTNDTGVGISSAIVTNFIRTSDGNCSAYPTLPETADIANLNQTYRTDFTPPQINIPLPVSADLVCASQSQTGNNVSLNFTVLVDYNDGTRRRRRNLDLSQSKDSFEKQLFRRKSASTPVGSYFGASYTADDLNAALGQAPPPPPSNNMGIYIGLAVGLTLLCFCFCCCCVAGVFLYRRNQKNKEKAFNGADVSAFSSMNMNSGMSQSAFDVTKSQI